MDVEAHNRRQIEQLNQRGGRALSVVDLIEAGTIKPEMAALCWVLIRGGAGLLTGAVPGSAGKTTLMAALLGFLPSGEPIVTVTDRSSLDEVGAALPPVPFTVLVHEIGAGRVFGYLWNREAVDFLRLGVQDGVRCVSCLHADNPEQTSAALSALGACDGELAAAPLQLYMHAGDGRYRVTSMNWVTEDGAVPLYRWDAGDDTFEPCAGRDELAADLAARVGADADDFAADWRAREGQLTGLVRDGVRDYDEVRRRML